MIQSENFYVYQTMAMALALVPNVQTLKAEHIHVLSTGMHSNLHHDCVLALTQISAGITADLNAVCNFCHDHNIHRAMALLARAYSHALANHFTTSTSLSEPPSKAPRAHPPSHSDRLQHGHVRTILDCACRLRIILDCVFGPS